jgi:hypothetical protein
MVAAAVDPVIPKHCTRLPVLSAIMAILKEMGMEKVAVGIMIETGEASRKVLHQAVTNW